MATRFGNSGRGEITPGRPSNLDGDLNREKVTTGQPSNQKETNPGQPPQVEGGDGPELTEAKLMNQVLSLVWSELRKLQEIFRLIKIEVAEKYYESLNINPKEKLEKLQKLANLKSFLDTVSGNPEGTEGLETMIEIAFECIQQFGIGDYVSQQLAFFVLDIAKDFKDSVKIVEETQFSYETKVSFLKRLISLIVGLILKVGPNDSDGSEFRGVKFKEADRVHPNNALLAALDEAARILLNEAAALNKLEELRGTLSDLLKMTKKLRADELRTIDMYIRGHLLRQKSR